jgi:UDP-N-acetyl-D-glucosamine dehydrogenase
LLDEALVLPTALCPAIREVFMSVVVIGLGYVGLPLALAATTGGHRVVGLDLRAEVVSGLNAGQSHVDDVSDEDVRAGLKVGFSATDDPEVVRDAQIVVVCVPTPLRPDGGPDLSHVVSVAEMLRDRVAPGTLCILESTTYPGTTEDIFLPLVAGDRLTVGEDINVVFSPERVDPGNRAYGVRNTPKIVGGVTPACLARATAFYKTFVDEVVPVPGPREAELAKLIENTFRFVNIALVNELMQICHQLDVDIWESLRAAATKPFGYMPFWPGPGVGGHCIPVDPSYLSHHVKTQLGYPFRLIESASEVNNQVPVYVATRIWQLLNRKGIPLRGAHVLLIGVTYKADISDVRESPASQIASVLHSWGAQVEFHDPYVEEWHVDGIDDPIGAVPDVYVAARQATVSVFLQAHSEYDLRDLIATGADILDTRGVMPREDNVERL